MKTLAIDQNVNFCMQIKQLKLENIPFIKIETKIVISAPINTNEININRKNICT
jgi:hypothetical protein